MKKILLLLIVIGLFISCGNVYINRTGDKSIKVKNFLKEYFHVLNLNGQFIKERDSEFLDINSFVIIPFMVNSYENPEPYFKRATKEEFRVLSELNNDTEFNYSINHTFDGIVAVNPIISIDLITNDDYDMDHPSGSILNDIVSVTFYDAKNYLKNGYKFDVDAEKPQYSSDILNFERVDSLENFNKGDHEFIAVDYIKLRLKVPPTQAGTYRFSLRCVDVNGKVFYDDLDAIKIKH